MKVADLMTTEVVTANPSMSLKDAAAKLVEFRISGLPVCEDDGAVVGVISEGDILYKQRGASERDGILARLLAIEEPAAAAKAHATTVDEAMTSPAITIAPYRPAAAAARIMVDEGINRLPVVGAGGALVGIVTRADLIRAFTRTDETIERDIREQVRAVLWAEPSAVDLTVRDGAVVLAGDLQTSADVDVLEELVERTPGVVSLRSQLRSRNGDQR